MTPNILTLPQVKAVAESPFNLSASFLLSESDKGDANMVETQIHQLWLGFPESHAAAIKHAVITIESKRPNFTVYKRVL